MYQTRHTFASLMLSYGEDPLWVARMLGHTSTEMLYRHYGKFIRNRMRRDGAKFLKGFEEAVFPCPKGTFSWPVRSACRAPGVRAAA